MKIEDFFSEKDINLINSVTHEKLPILIKGKESTGKYILCNYLKKDYGKELVALNEEIFWETKKPIKEALNHKLNIKKALEGKEFSNLVISELSDKPIIGHSELGDYINIGCFYRGKSNSYYVFIRLVKKRGDMIVEKPYKNNY